jgi:hypothetical protein
MCRSFVDFAGIYCRQEREPISEPNRALKIASLL